MQLVANFADDLRFAVFKVIFFRCSERLALCAATARTIRICMELLGLNPIDKM